MAASPWRREKAQTSSAPSPSAGNGPDLGAVPPAEYAACIACAGIVAGHRRGPLREAARIRYEAVHEISDWDDLRRRIDKQVVEEICREMPKLSTFVTLSPVTNFAAWLKREREQENSTALSEADKALFAKLDVPIR
jgi:hypothetical protein